ncbi:MAG: TIGR00725 family protein [Dehalococcoidia bacterium]|nr:TIGR00725 family protein [Dehalococcoidia bacterium]
MLTVAVIGGAACSPEEAALAEEVGALLAEKSVTVICGGLGGVMEAACQGAASRGGLTVGILPGNDRTAANKWVALPIATGIGQARNLAVVRSSQAVIAIGGAYGTLSEIAFALDARIPVVGIGTWRLDADRSVPAAVHPASSASEAVRLALELVRDSVSKE